MAQPVPEICSFNCPHAEFPPAETAGICRTMAAVWCLQLVQLVNKNTPCEWKKRSSGAARANLKSKPPARRSKPRGAE